jgi:hypothetical protein
LVTPILDLETLSLEEIRPRLGKHNLHTSPKNCTDRFYHGAIEGPQRKLYLSVKFIIHSPHKPGIHRKLHTARAALGTAKMSCPCAIGRLPIRHRHPWLIEEHNDIGARQKRATDAP